MDMPSYFSAFNRKGDSFGFCVSKTPVQSSPFKEIVCPNGGNFLSLRGLTSTEKGEELRIMQLLPLKIYQCTLRRNSYCDYVN